MASVHKWSLEGIHASLAKATASDGVPAASWPREISAQLAGLALLMLLCAFARWWWSGWWLPASRSAAGKGGGRYERASTVAVDDEEEPMRGCAYDRAAATLCVDVFPPASKTPTQIEMSTVGVGTSAKLLRQLLLVVGEVCGRRLVREELSVSFERSPTDRRLLHSGCDLADVFAATRVVAKVRTDADVPYDDPAAMPPPTRIGQYGADDDDPADFTI